MRVILFFDQIQAGLGGKERANTVLGLEKGGIGSYLMFKDYFQAHGLQVIATVYCGSDFFTANREAVIDKICRLIDKTHAEVLFCGPCFNYSDYVQMSIALALAIQERTDCQPYVMCSAENTSLINQYQAQLPLLKMPKKGGTGLTAALKLAAQAVSQPAAYLEAFYQSESGGV